MTKQHFIALADSIRAFNDKSDPEGITSHQPMNSLHLRMLADFCAAQNPAFNRSRWLAYLAGDCGPNGGKLKR